MKHLYEVNVDLEMVLDHVLEHLDHQALPGFADFLQDFAYEVNEIYEAERSDHDY